MSVIVVCDGCGTHGAVRYYLSAAIGNGKGTKNLRKGDLCSKCADALPLTRIASKSGPRGPHHRTGVSA